MTLFDGPEEHEANPPETWKVYRVGDRSWMLATATNVCLEGFTTRRAAMAARTSGFNVDLWRKESRWYAGENVHPWKSWAEVKAEREHRAEVVRQRFQQRAHV